MLHSQGLGWLTTPSGQRISVPTTLSFSSTRSIGVLKTDGDPDEDGGIGHVDARMIKRIESEGDGRRVLLCECSHQDIRVWE